MQLTLLLHQGNEESLPWLGENPGNEDSLPWLGENEATRCVSVSFYSVLSIFCYLSLNNFIIYRLKVTV